MAYISALDEEDDEGRQTAAPPPVAGAPVAGAPVAPVAQQPAASRFVNFSRYLNANRDAASRTAQSISGSIDQNGQSVQNDLAGAQTAFGTAVQSGSNPVTGYTGPTSLADNKDQWTGLQDRARGVQDSATATASSGGLGALLQDQNRGAYGAGNRRLDTALTGYAGADQFAQTRERYGKLSDALTQANDASSKTAETSRATTTEAKTRYDAEQAAIAARAAATKQTTDDDKLLGDVNTLYENITKSLPKLSNPLHQRERFRLYEPQLREQVDRRYGQGAWDRYVAAKDKRNTARADAVRATVPGGL
jgi:hypothetical protein